MKKYVVITGASSGIGYEMAKEFAKLNKNLVLVARRKEKLEVLKEEILFVNNNIDIKIFCYNLLEEKEVYEFYNELKDIDIEVFINNAGFGYNKDVIDQDLRIVSNMIDLNIKTLTILSTLFVKDYSDINGTQLINVSSIGGYSASKGAISYCATKFFVSSFSEALSKELKLLNKPLSVKVLAPSATKTEFMQVASQVNDFTYSGNFTTAKDMAKYAILLYKSDKELGIVDEDFNFVLKDGIYPFRTKLASKGE